MADGQNCAAVTAVAAAGFVFTGWTRDGSAYSTQNPLLVTNVTADQTITASFATCDTTPDVLTFPEQTGVARNRAVVSDALSVSGLTCPAPISVSGGEYSIGSGPWTPAPGMIENGQLVRLRQISASEWSTRTTCELTVGDLSSTWGVATTDCRAHEADQNGDWVIQLSPELTRLIQFYNLRGYHCAAGTEDGYAAGPAGADPAETACGPHQADQNGDWEIQLSPELTRLIQFYNSGGYHCAVGTEDGYAPSGDGRKGAAKPGALSAARSLRPAPGAGDAIEVAVTLAPSRPQAVTSLLVQERLPRGWQFAGIVGTEKPAIAPRTGDTGVLGFAWVSMPTAWPVRLTYRIIPGAAAGAAQPLRGTAGWREAAEESTVVIPAATLTPPLTMAPQPAAPGQCSARVDAAGVGHGQGLWDLSGVYATTVDGNPLVMNMINDSYGALSGVGTYTFADGTAVALPLKGSVRGAAGSIAMSGTLKGADPTRTVDVALTAGLALDPARRQLVGRLLGSIRAAGAITPVHQDLRLPLPAAMDGTWSLRFQLGGVGRTVTGGAVLTLANGVERRFVVQGRAQGSGVAVSLMGDPADPAAKGITMRLTMTPQADGSATLESLSARGYGQALDW